MEGKNLVIVESPAKAGTIQKFLGKDFIVKSSFGHIRDLNDSGLSIDVENGFKPEYVIPSDKKKVVSELKKAAKEASTDGLHPMRTVRERPYHGTCPRRSVWIWKGQKELFSTRLPNPQS